MQEPNELQEAMIAFAKMIEEQRAAGNDPVPAMRRKAATEEFKGEYGVSRSTPFRCPACQGMHGGTLWIDENKKNRFVCRQCKLEWEIQCDTINMDEIWIRIKNKDVLNPKDDRSKW